MTPFDCLNARALPVLPRDDHYQQDYPVVEHRFQSLCWPVLQTVANGGKAYCNHCGSPVLQNALECLGQWLLTVEMHLSGRLLVRLDCQMFIHQQCVSNVPPMCAKLLPAPTDERVPSVASAPTPPPARPSTRPSFAHFECFAQLGSGRYGHVYGVKHLPSGKYMAVKVVDGSDREACEQFPSEKHILLDCHLDNPYILRGYCSFHCGVSHADWWNRTSIGLLAEQSLPGHGVRRRRHTPRNDSKKAYERYRLSVLSSRADLGHPVPAFQADHSSVVAMREDNASCIARLETSNSITSLSTITVTFG